MKRKKLESFLRDMFADLARLSRQAEVPRSEADQIKYRVTGRRHAIAPLAHMSEAVPLLRRLVLKWDHYMPSPEQLKKGEIGVLDQHEAFLKISPLIDEARNLIDRTSTASSQRLRM